LTWRCGAQALSAIEEIARENSSVTVSHARRRVEAYGTPGHLGDQESDAPPVRRHAAQSPLGCKSR